MPCRTSGPASAHAWSRFLRTTAVRMNLPATRRAAGDTFSWSFTLSTVLAGGELGAGASSLPDVPDSFGTIRTSAATTPATSTRPAIQGNHRWNLRELVTSSNLGTL